jgi:hypothetical protein
VAQALIVRNSISHYKIALPSHQNSHSNPPPAFLQHSPRYILKHSISLLPPHLKLNRHRRTSHGSLHTTSPYIAPIPLFGLHQSSSRFSTTALNTMSPMYVSRSVSCACERPCIELARTQDLCYLLQGHHRRGPHRPQPIQRRPHSHPSGRPSMLPLRRTRIPQQGLHLQGLNPTAHLMSSQAPWL